MLCATLKIASTSAEAIISSLRPEASRELPRTHISMDMNGKDAVIKITANDTSAMRAALNSYLECIRITEDIKKITR